MGRYFGREPRYSQEEAEAQAKEAIDAAVKKGRPPPEEWKGLAPRMGEIDRELAARPPVDVPEPPPSRTQTEKGSTGRPRPVSEILRPRAAPAPEPSASRDAAPAAPPAAEAPRPPAARKKPATRASAAAAAAAPAERVTPAKAAGPGPVKRSTRASAPAAKTPTKRPARAAGPPAAGEGKRAAAKKRQR